MRAGGPRRQAPSRPIGLSPDELAALGQVIDAWEAETVRRLREQLPD